MGEERTNYFVLSAIKKKKKLNSVRDNQKVYLKWEDRVKVDLFKIFFSFK